MRFSALDGWRGICAMGVVLFHAGGPIAWSGSDLALLREANLFVDYFFVLSGFVMGHTYDDRIEDMRSAGVFMIRRFGRLWPLHLAVLALYIALELVALVIEGHFGNFAAHPAFTYDKTPSSLLTNLLLIHSLGIHDQFTWNTPSWSISVEFWTYVVFAGMLVLAKRHRSMIAVGLAGFGVAGIAISGRYMEAAFDYGILRCLYGFFLGYLVFRLCATRPSGPVVKLHAATAVEALVVVLLVLYVSYLDKPPYSLLGSPLFALSVFVFSLEQGRLSQWLSGWPFQQIGTWSYSIYMIHMLMLVVFIAAIRFIEKGFHLHLRGTTLLKYDGELQFTFGSTLAGDAVVAAFALAVIAAASLTYRFIEDPCRHYANGVADRLSAPRRVAWNAPRR
jgi:peptidoglycan/LPS O-acetylase OafA/YrhL